MKRGLLIILSSLWLWVVCVPADPARPASIYDRPYSFLDTEMDYALLIADTKAMASATVVAMGALYALPSNVTRWDKGNISMRNLFGKWWDNVSAGPVVDEDNFFFNYVTHPYCGAVYYMGARSAGAGAPYAFTYSALLSTVFWEYGIEAFAEVPSVQDLIITPVVGSLFGEGFYLSKRYIAANDYRLFNSKILGHGVAFLLDPITEVAGLFLDDPESALRNEDVFIFAHPSFSAQKFLGVNLVFSVRF